MKTLTKAKRFIEGINNIEQLNERQLVKLLNKAKDIVSEYICTENKKEQAHNRLKQETKYATKKKTSVKRVMTLQIENKTNIINNLSREDKNMNNLVIQSVNEKKGVILGSYVNNNTRTYFAMSKNYSHPIVFGAPDLTTAVLCEIVKQMPEYSQGIKKDLKSVSYFGTVGNKKAMVHMVDAKREVFEGYIGNYLFSTTTAYLASGYKPLVTEASRFVNNGGKHNPPLYNACTEEMNKVIRSLIDSYKTTIKYEKAKLDTQYINAIKNTRATKSNNVAVLDVRPRNIELNPGCVYVGESGIVDPVAILQASYDGGVVDCIEF